MPTLLRQDGFEFVIRTHDHAPAHIHIFRAGTEVVINLESGGNLAEIREINGMSNRNVRRAFEMTIANSEMFLRRWREIHG